MNLVYGEIVAVSREGEIRMGKIRVGGAMKTVLLDLVTGAEIGTRFFCCDGVAIAKVDTKRKMENNYVSGHSGKAH
jgi:hydrogenase maturation factor